MKKIIIIGFSLTLLLSCTTIQSYKKNLDKLYFDTYIIYPETLQANEIKTLLELSEPNEFFNQLNIAIQRKNIIFNTLSSSYSDDFNFWNILTKLFILANNPQYTEDVFKTFIALNYSKNPEFDCQVFFRIHKMIMRSLFPLEKRVDTTILQEFYNSFPTIKQYYLSAYSDIYNSERRFPGQMSYDYDEILKGYKRINNNNICDVLKGNDLLFMVISDKGFDKYCDSLSQFINEIESRRK